MTGAVPERLAEQRQLQIRLTRERMTAAPTVMLAVGLVASAAGLAAAVLSLRQGDVHVARLLAFGALTVLFLWAVGSWLTWPHFVKPRVVPCFARALGEPRGPGSAAFWGRGAGVHREAGALDELALKLGVTPLSAFGYADEHFEQEPSWHPAKDGLSTVQALRANLSPALAARRDVVDDLDALVSVLGEAMRHDVTFSLVLRLHAGESLQAVSTRENRRGSFW